MNIAVAVYLTPAIIIVGYALKTEQRIPWGKFAKLTNRLYVLGISISGTPRLIEALGKRFVVLAMTLALNTLLGKPVASRLC